MCQINGLNPLRESKTIDLRVRLDIDLSMLHGIVITGQNTQGNIKSQIKAFRTESEKTHDKTLAIILDLNVVFRDIYSTKIPKSGHKYSLHFVLHRR